MKGSSGTGTLKTRQKLEKSVQAGNYYEAQQMYKTIFARYAAAKKYEEAMEILQSGACVQLQHGQVTCGVELGVLLVETFTKAGMKYDASAIDRIKSVANNFPRENIDFKQRRDIEKTSEVYQNAKVRVEGFCTFVKAAIKWCIISGGPRRGPPELHEMVAEYMWSQSPDTDLSIASYHFVRSQHPEKYAAALISFIKETDSEDADLVIARAVLLYLSQGNLKDANKIMDEFKKGLGDEKFPSSPLMQFIKYLLLTLERDALPLFRMLRENYKPYLMKDLSLGEYLDAIGERFYGVENKNGLQRMFGDIMKQMFAAEPTS